MAYVLGTPAMASGCLTRLIDIVNRAPTELEDLVGFHRGRLANGFYLLLLKQPLAPMDFEFYGYTYMSGGKIGLPSNSARPKVDDLVRSTLHNAGPRVAPDVYEQFARAIRLNGQERYVKIVPVIGHDDAMPMADQYPASKKGITQLNLKKDKAKIFLVAAEIHGSIWALADRTKIDVGARPRYDQPYGNDPQKKVIDFLASA
jgi:hypothetical protein